MHPLIINIYKNGDIVDTVSLIIEDVKTEHGCLCKMIAACDSEKLNVVYYNLDTQE